MLIEFRFKNYRSFRDEATLSMEATGLGAFKNSLIKLSSTVMLFMERTVAGRAMSFVRSGWRCNLSAMHKGHSMSGRVFRLDHLL